MLALWDRVRALRLERDALEIELERGFPPPPPPPPPVLTSVLNYGSRLVGGGGGGGGRARYGG